MKIDSVYVPYEQALVLKKLGFDELCFTFFQTEYIEIQPIMVDDDDEYKMTGYRTCRNSEIPDHYTAAPTFSQVFKWLLKCYNLYKIIIPTNTMYWTFKTMTVVENMIEVPPYNHVDANDYKTFEEAELASLIKLIELAKETKSKITWED